jgi:tellurite resistance protein
MSVRKILSARAARPQVEAMMDSLVHAAVFIGGADGRFGEDELNVFIDSMREVVSSAVGDQALDDLASTSRLMDQARKARQSLQKEGSEAFLSGLATRFPSNFSRDGLVLAYRIVMADAKVTEKEAQAFEALSAALGLELEETQVLKELAAKSEAASKAGYRGSSVEQVRELESRGWTAAPKDDAFDAGVSFTQADGGKIALELDSGESVLHVNVTSSDGKGPHLVCFFGDALPALLAVLDGVKTELKPSTLGAKLPAVRAVCGELFVEHEGRFAKL